MTSDTVPLRKPASWTDPGIASLLQAGSVRWSFIDEGKLPQGVVTVKGPWPGIRLSRSGGDHAAAGPTGEPWVDSNGWRIRVARALHPNATIWVDSNPQPSRSSPRDYLLALADAAAHDAQWIVTLDDRLAAGIAARKPDDLAAWKRISDTAAFFSAIKRTGYQEDAVIGVLSNFSGPKVGFTNEVLNNLARTRQLYRAVSAASPNLTGLKGIIYTDAGEPAGSLRKQVMDFVNAGGALITGPAWGSLPKGSVGDPHPRFSVRKIGNGTAALATTSFSDPYMVPNDAVALVSHRSDIVRYFNAGAITPCLSISADRRRAMLDTVFYSLRPVEDVTVWIKGSWRSARLRTPAQPQPQNVRLEKRDTGVEIYLPPVPQYGLVELQS